MAQPGSYALRGVLGIAAIVAAGVLLSQSTAESSASLGDRVDVATVFGGKSIRSLSDSFDGGDVVAVMSGLDLDLRDVVMEGDEAVVDVFVMMGGVNVRVPENWAVTPDFGVLFGGVDDRTRAAAEDATNNLVLRGTIFMGGLDIRN